MTKLCVCFIFDRLGLVIFLILLAGCFSFWRYRYQQSLVVQSCNHTGYAPFVQSASTQNIPAHLVSIPGDVSTNPTQLHQGVNSMAEQNKRLSRHLKETLPICTKSGKDIVKTNWRVSLF